MARMWRSCAAFDPHTQGVRPSPSHLVTGQAHAQLRVLFVRMHPRAQVYIAVLQSPSASQAQNKELVSLCKHIVRKFLELASK